MTLNADQKKRLAAPYFGDEKVATWHFQALAGAGALRSTAADMVIFGNSLLHPEKTPLEEALTLLIKSRSEDGKNGLSLGHYKIHDENVMGHNGGTGGYRSLLEIVPTRQLVRVILINNTSLDPSHIVSLSKGDKMLPDNDRKSRNLPAEKLAEYPGVYLIETAALKGSKFTVCLLYTSPSPRDGLLSRMPSSA